jgi:transposase
MEACVGAHHLSRKLQLLGHNARLMRAKYVRPYNGGRKNYFRDAEAIAGAVQRPTMKFVATKSADQLDLQVLRRVRERLVSQRTGIVNQIRAFLLERGISVRQGLRFLRAERWTNGAGKLQRSQGRLVMTCRSCSVSAHLGSQPRARALMRSKQPPKCLLHSPNIAGVQTCRWHPAGIPRIIEIGANIKST